MTQPDLFAQPAERAAQLRAEIARLDHAYYVLDAPLVPDAGYDALARWLDADAGRETAGRAAREHVATNHAIEGEARAIVEVYRKLLA